MAAQPGSYQASNNSGELGPELHGRTDIKQYYSGLSYGRNVEPVPQSGSRKSPRSRSLGRIRHKLVDVGIAPTIDLGPFTTNCTIATMTFSARAVSVVVAEGLAADNELAGLCRFEWFDGITWAQFGSSFDAGADVAVRTAALAPGASVMASGIRLRAIGSFASTTFSLADLTAMHEGSDLSGVKLRPFTFSLDQTYTYVLYDGFADFYRDGVYVGSSSTGVSEADLATVGIQQRLDTMLLFHKDLPSVRILRDGSDTQWRRDAVPFANIPQVNLGGTYTNAVRDEWEIHVSYPNSGDFAGGKDLVVAVTIDGEETPGVSTGDPVDFTQFATDLEAAINGLPSITSGVTVVLNSSSAKHAQFDVAFDGEELGRRASMTAQVANTAEAAATVVHAQIGVAGGEPLSSVTAGYARTGAFYQDRLVVGGFRSKNGALLASITGEYFDQNILVENAAGAILVNLDTDGAEEIQALSRARHLLIFTSEGEYFISDRVLSRAAPPTIVNSSRNGSAPGVPIIESEGSLLYYTPDREDPLRHGVLLYAMTYDDVSQAYVSEPLSLLASHIVQDVTGAALQKASTASDANRLWSVRGDGTMVEGVMIRNQEVTAFVRWETDGEVLDVCVDGKSVTHILVQRVTDGSPEIYLERLEEALLFDATVEIVNAPASATVAGLDIHEGAEVWALADGYVEGPFTVTGGALTLPFEAATILVGRWTPPLARLLPLPSDVAERTVLRRPKRVHTVRIDLIDTTSVAIGANGEAADDVPLYFDGAPADAPPPLFTGTVPVEGLVGYSDDGIVEITQVRPGPLQWRGITVEARL